MSEREALKGKGREESSESSESSEFFFLTKKKQPMKKNGKRRATELEREQPASHQRCRRNADTVLPGHRHEKRTKAWNEGA